MGKLRPFVRKDSYMPNKKWIPFVIGNGYTTTDGASGPAPEYETVTGNPVSFNAITPFPLKQLQIAFSPVQSGSGDPSPDNVRPISGWDSLNVWQRGVNLWDGEWEYGNISDSTGRNSGTSTSYFRAKNYCKMPSNTNLYWYSPYRSGNFRQYFYDKDFNYLGHRELGWNRVIPVTDYGWAKDIAYFRFRVASAHNDTYDSKISINYPTTVQEYVPYNSDGISISINFTKNLFDVSAITDNTYLSAAGNTGSSTVSFVSDYIPVTGGEKYALSSTGYDGLSRAICWYTSEKSYISGEDFSDNPYTTSTMPSNAAYVRFAYYNQAQDVQFELGETATAYEAYVQYYSGTLDVLTGVLKVRPYFASYNGETLVGPWMSSMDKYVAGATPTVGAQVVDMGGAETTIQLTPQEVESLLGGNTMWSDANGDLTVTYAVATATTPIVGTGKVGQAIIGG